MDTLREGIDRLDLLVDRLLKTDTPAWSTLTHEDLSMALSTTPVAAYVVAGLQLRDARSIHELLESELGYLGAVELQPSNEVTWSPYKLPAFCRIIGREIRLFYREHEQQIEDMRDHALYEFWRNSGLFARVAWEDLGASETIFDPYRFPDYDRLLGEAEDLVGMHLAGVVNEIFLRMTRLDPRLIQLLHGALRAFDQLDTADSIAQVSISCRRLIERLADALYPPTKESRDGRNLGKAQYRNRLWAYVEENLKSKTQRDLILATFKDVGDRIDKLDRLVNKGLHSSLNTTEMQRTLISLITTLYDLLTISPPSVVASMDPYSESILGRRPDDDS